MARIRNSTCCTFAGFTRRMAVVRPRVGDADIARAIGRGMQHEGKPYDFDFDFSRSDRLVCTEVVYRQFRMRKTPSRLAICSGNCSSFSRYMLRTIPRANSTAPPTAR